jgi:hypothetical protein
MDHAEEQERDAMNRILEIALYLFAERARRAEPNFPTIICALALTTSVPAHAEELGRLFYTPEQRAQMDIEHARDTTPANSPNVMSIDGIVQRHGGERTVWINGVPQAAGQSDDRSPDSVPVAIPGQSQPVKVKVGQKIIVNPAPAGE